MNSAATPVGGEDANNGSYLSVEPVAVVGVLANNKRRIRKCLTLEIAVSPTLRISNLLTSNLLT